MEAWIKLFRVLYAELMRSVRLHTNSGAIIPAIVLSRWTRDNAFIFASHILLYVSVIIVTSAVLIASSARLKLLCFRDIIARFFAGTCKIEPRRELF